MTAAMAQERPDLKNYVGQKLIVIAWLWARTVKSPNPAFSNVDVPLASTFMLGTRPGKEAYVQPVIEGGGYRFTVKVGKPKDVENARNGTKLSRGANFQCLLSGTPISGDYIKAEGKAGRMGARMMAIVAEGVRGRVYLPPTEAMEAVAREANRQGRDRPRTSRLYTLCERKKRAAEALAYNGLVLSWPERTRLAREGGKPRSEQRALFAEETADE